MKNKILIPTLLAGLMMLSLNSFTQSISGNVNSSGLNLGYANVDIFRNGKLVANVLTDKDGNFKVNLDTGLYICKIHYAGHSTVSREIRVTSDEKSEFVMSEDEKSVYKGSAAARVATVKTLSAPAKSKSSRSSVSHSDEVMLMDVAEADYSGTPARGRVSNSRAINASFMWGMPKDSASVSGKLTAGEINDFAKWNQWEQLSSGELRLNALYYNIIPTQRYVLQLIDNFGLPLADAKVDLLLNDKEAFTARTDNTGKAELWESLKDDSLKKQPKAVLRISYGSETKIIRNAKRFSEGINHLVMDVSCEQPQNVDIAFVVDATGSMQDEINYLKMDLNDVVYQSKEISRELNLRYANIFYRDHGDQYLTSTQDFTRTLSESVAFTDRHNATGGGDYEEAVEVALDSAINRLNWSENARARILFLVLDAPPHRTPEIMEKLHELCYAAAAKGIRIVPLTGSGTNKNTEYLMRAMALATNGTYTFLTNHSGIGNPHIKPSTDNYQVEILNNLLVRVIRSFTYMPDCRQFIPDMEVNLPDSAVIISQPKDTVSTSLPLNPAVPELQWRFYPNPTNGILHIVANKDITELYISDLSGKALQVVKDIKADKTVTLDLSLYSTGIYLIRYPIGKQWISGKIVLVRE